MVDLESGPVAVVVARNVVLVGGRRRRRRLRLEAAGDGRCGRDRLTASAPRPSRRFWGRAGITYHDGGPAAARPALRRRAAVLPTAPGDPWTHACRRAASSSSSSPSSAGSAPSSTSWCSRRRCSSGAAWSATRRSASRSSPAASRSASPWSTTTCSTAGGRSAPPAASACRSSSSSSSAVAGLGLNELAFWLFRGQLDIGVLVSQCLAIVCVLPFNFIVNKLWSFRET